MGDYVSLMSEAIISLICISSMNLNNYLELMVNYMYNTYTEIT